jgi:hypothetical protein
MCIARTLLGVIEDDALLAEKTGLPVPAAAVPALRRNKAE